MKRKHKKTALIRSHSANPLVLAFVALASSIIGYTLLTMSFAASNRLYLNPASQTVVQGNSFNATVYLDAGEDVDAVQANLTYPANLLEVTSISGAYEPFEIAAQNSYGNGTIGIARGTTPPAVSGNGLSVAIVTFKAKAPGAATVQFASGTALAHGGSSLSMTTSSATYTVTSNAVTPPPPPPVTPPASSSSKTTPKSSSSVKSQPSTSTPTAPTTSTPEATAPTPEEIATGSSAETVSSVTLRLYIVEGAVALGPDDAYAAGVKKPAGGALVKINGKQQKADKYGNVTFTNVPPGEQTVVVNYKGKVSSSRITVSDSAATQSFTIVASAKGATPTYGILLWLALLAMVVGVIALFRAVILHRRHAQSFELATASGTVGPTVTGPVASASSPAKPGAVFRSGSKAPDLTSPNKTSTATSGNRPGMVFRPQVKLKGSPPKPPTEDQS